MKTVAEGQNAFIHTSYLPVLIPDLSVTIITQRSVRVECILGFENVNIGKNGNILDQAFLMVDGKMVEQTINPDFEVILFDGRKVKGPGFSTIVEVTMNGVHMYQVAASRQYFSKERCLQVSEV